MRVPRYASLILNANCSITAPTWNGSTGGIVAVDVRGDVTLNTGASIDVSGKGFRGGALSNSPTSVNGAGSTAYAYGTNANGAEKGEVLPVTRPTTTPWAAATGLGLRPTAAAAATTTTAAAAAAAAPT